MARLAFAAPGRYVGPVRTKLSPAAKWWEPLRFSFVLSFSLWLGALCRDIAIERPPGNAQTAPDTLDGAGLGLMELQGHRKRVGINRSGTTPISTSATGARYPCQRPLAYEAPFEFRKGSRDLKKELASRRGRVYRFHEVLKANLLAL
jgi:hypothetical protein